MEKELKYASVSGTPSDYDCPDGEIALAANLVPENAALHPVLPPKPVFDLLEGEELLWIHKFKGHTHYIILLTVVENNTTTRTLKWVCEENAEGDNNTWTRHTIGVVDGEPILNSIGKTLIVNDDTGINYYLWKPDNVETIQGQDTVVPKYIALGQKPPMLEIKFGLHSDFAVYPDKKNTNQNKSGYHGVYVNAGNIKEPILPHLGANGNDQLAKPKPEMGDSYDNWADTYATYSIEDVAASTDDEINGYSAVKNKMTQGVFSAVNALVNKKGAEENKFVLPFFVRYAYKLYDDSYIMHSYPVLMIPNSRGPVFGLDGVLGLRLNKNDNDFVGYEFCGRAYAFISSLVYSYASIPEGLMDWKDIITSVDIGVSAPIYTYDQAGTVWGWTNMDGTNDWDEFYSISQLRKIADESISAPIWNGLIPFKSTFETMVTNTATTAHSNNYGDYFNPYVNGSSQAYKYPSYIATVPQHDISEINKSLTSAANFYIIKKFTLDELGNSPSEADLNLEKGTLSGLLGRETIKDDYHTHDTLKASLMHNFNKRINYADIVRTPHSPIKPSIQFAQLNTTGTDSSWQVAVTIKNDMQTITVQSDAETDTNGIDFPRWIFYPDANAKFAYVTKGSTHYKLKLKPHDFLNGAYWLADIMKQDVVSGLTSVVSIPDISTSGFNEENKVYTSNVNNPFVFEPTNINTVGTGKILGICPAVKPLAADQYGKAPLYVFSNEGVWAMDTTNEGTYGTVWYVTRDICNNPDSITQLDDSVLFTSDRGIMLISGNQVQCISEILDSRAPFDLTSLPNNNSGSLASLVGLTSKTILNFTPAELGIVTPISGTPGPITFKEYLTGARMIYDYVHQRIIVYNPATNKNYAYVFSLESKQWGMMATNLVSSVNSYPNALAIDSDRHVVDLCGEGDFSNGVDIALITRPFKLDMTDVHKTIDNIIQRGMFRTANNSCQLKQILYGSRDLYNWQLVNSSTNHYMRGFSGTPYKYFRLVVFGKLLHDESLTSASVEYDTRLTNQPR